VLTGGVNAHGDTQGLDDDSATLLASIAFYTAAEGPLLRVDEVDGHRFRDLTHRRDRYGALRLPLVDDKTHKITKTDTQDHHQDHKDNYTTIKMWSDGRTTVTRRHETDSGSMRRFPRRWGVARRPRCALSVVIKALRARERRRGSRPMSPGPVDGPTDDRTTSPVPEVRHGHALDSLA